MKPTVSAIWGESVGGLNKERQYSQSSHDRTKRNSYLQQNTVCNINHKRENKYERPKKREAAHRDACTTEEMKKNREPSITPA